MPDNLWTDRQIERLKFLHLNRLTSREIAADLGCGKTRNAVIAKIHRLGLPRPVKVVRPGRPHKPNRPQWLRKQKLTRYTEPKMLPNQEPESLNIELFKLEPHHCRYPYGENPYFFCGHPATKTTSYCDFHSRLTVTKSRAGMGGNYKPQF